MAVIMQSIIDLMLKWGEEQKVKNQQLQEAVEVIRNLINPHLRTNLWCRECGAPEDAEEKAQAFLEKWGLDKGEK